MTIVERCRMIVSGALRFVLALYIAACVASILLIFTSSEALSGVFAVVLATPWMFVIEALEPSGLWSLLPVIGAMGVNAAIIYVIIRIIRPAR